MDDTTYSDHDVIRFINENFVPVRVDADHRPDLNARYNVGGWPTSAFLTAHGGLIGGATYLPADQLLAMLNEARLAYEQQKPDLYERSRAIMRQRREQAARAAAGAALPEGLVDRIARQVAGIYDPKHGGFGFAPKFPVPHVLRFLAHLCRVSGEAFYRLMLEKSLDAMLASPLFDNAEGGFFRYSASADWSEAQHEKLLEDNALLARVYLEAYLLLGKAEYRDAASRAVDCLLQSLYDAEAQGFRGSQGAHSEYFDLSLEARLNQEPPPVDPSCYVSGNAQAVSLLLFAAWGLARPELTGQALDVLERLCGMIQTGLSHVYTAAGPGDSPAFLQDWAHLLNALLDAHSYTSQPKHLERAREVARILLDKFFDEQNGAFFDIEADPKPLGLLAVREKPLLDNVAAALGFLRLRHEARDDDYRHVAEATLSAYTEAHRDYGEHSAAFAAAVDMLQNDGVEVTLEGDPAHPGSVEMLKAAARLARPHLVFKFTAGDGPAAAHICLDTVCLPPVTNPAQLAAALERGASPASPFEDIFQRFGGLKP